MDEDENLQGNDASSAAPPMTNPDPARLPAPARPLVPRGALGRLVLRPWLDAVILKSITAGYMPLSRGWAAARAAAGDTDRFRELAPYDRPVSGRLESALHAIHRRDRAYRAAVAAWDECFFGAADVSDADLVAAEEQRRRAVHRLMASRLRLLPWIRRFDRVRWSIADRETVARAHSARLDGAGSDDARAGSSPCAREQMRNAAAMRAFHASES